MNNPCAHVRCEITASVVGDAAGSEVLDVNRSVLPSTCDRVAEWGAGRGDEEVLVHGGSVHGAGGYNNYMYMYAGSAP